MSSTETPAREGRVVVLAGGLSHERDVSLRSGRRVAEALRGTGIEVEERDVDADLLPAFTADPPACVVPLLHGETGEDGALREVLELLDLPYVGARPDGLPDRLRQADRQDRRRARRRTHPGVVLPAARDVPRARGGRGDGRRWSARLGLPLVVKPTRSGSALGCSVGARPCRRCPRRWWLLRLRRRRAGRAVRRGRRGGRLRGRRRLRGPGPCPRSRSSPTGASTTTRRATPPGATEFVVPAKLLRRSDRGVRAGRAGRARGARAARPVALRPDRRRRRHRVVPRGQRGAGNDRDVHGAARRGGGRPRPR